MAEIAIAGIFTQRKEDRFVRDCADPQSPPVQHHRSTNVLTIATDCPMPDEVIVNGVKFYSVRAA